MKHFNITHILFLPLLSTTTSPSSIFTAATTTVTPARDVQPNPELEWSCMRLKVQEDGHTIDYTCAIIAATLENPDGGNTGNNSHTNSSSSRNQHRAISGSLDLNACVGTTPGYPESGGGRLALESDGCVGNLCRHCAFVATAAGSDTDANAVTNANVEGYPFAGPFGSANASLFCGECDSAEGLGMVRGRPALIDLADFLTFAEGRNGGLACKTAEDKDEDEEENKRALRGRRRERAPVGVMREAGEPWVGGAALDEPSFVPDEDQNAARHRQAPRSPQQRGNSAKQSTDEVCASRTSDPWTRFWKPLGGAGCDGIRLRADLHTLQANCTGGAGHEVSSLLDLDGCLRNAGGSLLPGDGGRFSGSCRNCRIDEADDGADLDGDGSRDITLSCMCGKGDNYEGTAYAELSSIDVLQVVAGQLMCQGRLGKLYTGDGTDW